MTMTNWRNAELGTLLVLSVAILGCGDSKKPTGKPAAPAAVNTTQLPELGDPIPMLDDGRIDVAPPKGWTVPARSNKFVVRFQQRTDSLYPTIIITADDYSAVPDVSEENVNEFAKKLAAEESLGTVKPIQVGSFVGVTYRKQGREKDSLNKILERLFLDTAVAGRKYSIELRTREGSLPESEPYLMAVARGIKFLKAKTPAPATAEPVAETTEPTPAKPAETKPEAKPEAKPKAAAEKKPEAGEEKETKPSEKPKKKDDLDLDNLNLDELLK